MVELVDTLDLGSSAFTAWGFESLSGHHASETTILPSRIGDVMRSQNKIEFMPLSKLIFDPQNPRLPSYIREESNKKIIEWMILDASLIDLMSSIAQNGFFAGEPILAIPQKEKFVVVEGNRRLAAALILNKPSLTKVKFNSIREVLEGSKKENIPEELPVVIFQERNDILDYLGYRHITGVQSWGPLAKARYLDELYSAMPGKKNLDHTCTRLAKKIGSKRYYVKQLLVAHWLYNILEEEAFFRIRGLDESSIDFSNLYDSLRHPGIRNFLGIDFDKQDPIKKYNKDHFKEFCIWVFEKNGGPTKLGGGKNLSILDSVVQHKEALKKFRDGETLEEASKYSDLPNEIFSTHTANAYHQIKSARDIYHKIDKCEETALGHLKDVKKISSMLINQCDNTE